LSWVGVEPISDRFANLSALPNAIPKAHVKTELFHLFLFLNFQITFVYIININRFGMVVNQKVWREQGRTIPMVGILPRSAFQADPATLPVLTPV
jgi:hypothetical protein